MKIQLTPQSKIGIWSVRVGIVLILSMVLSVIFTFAIGGDSAVIEGSIILTILSGILSVLFTLSGPVSFILGLIALFKFKDWAVVRSLAVLYILTLLLFMLGEFSFSH